MKVFRSRADNRALLHIPILIILLLSFLGGCSKPAPGESAQKFIEYLEENNYSEMYQMLTTEAKSKITEDEFIAKYKSIYENIGLERIELEIDYPSGEKGFKIKDNRVDINIKGGLVTWTVGEIAIEQVLHLVYEEKKWRIDWCPQNILPQLTDIDDRIEVTRSPAERGSIYDRMGKQLAGIGNIYTIGLVPQKIKNQEEAINNLANLLDMNPEKIKHILQQKWVQPHLFVPLRPITQKEWEEKKDEFMAIPGMLASKSEARVYTIPLSLAPLIGYLGEINEKELKELKTKGYMIGDLIGRLGLEATVEELLSGKPGYMIRVVDQKGNEKAMVKYTRSMRGEDLFLTIDLSLQQIIDTVVEGRKGTVIAVNPYTGEILAMASFPGFDPNEFLLGKNSKRIIQLLNDEKTPLLNRSLQGMYIPGSTFKPITALAALEFNSDYDPFEKIELSEDTWRAEESWGKYRVKRISSPEGPVDLFDAMKRSDNIYFARLAYDTGSENLLKMGQRLGFGEKIPFLLDVFESSIARDGVISNSILLADTGYGQGQLLMSPLHLALIYSAFATEGPILKPVVTSYEEKGVIWKDNIASSENLQIIKDALRKTVEDPLGTAHKVNIPQLKIAGKTGTAQLGGEREMSWFICFTPVEKPEILLLVGLEDVLDRSQKALDVALEILKRYYNVSGIN